MDGSERLTLLGRDNAARASVTYHSDSAIAPVIFSSPQAQEHQSYFSLTGLLWFFKNLTLTLVFLYFLGSRLGASSSYGTSAQKGLQTIAKDIFNIEIDETALMIVFVLAMFANALIAFGSHGKKLADTATHLNDLYKPNPEAGKKKM